jgi:hypothetical protein
MYVVISVKEVFNFSEIQIYYCNCIIHPRNPVKLNTRIFYVLAFFYTEELAYEE